MKNLNEILDFIPTNGCEDRIQAKDDLRYGLSMKSTVVIENFVNTWVLTSESDLARMSSEDKAYRQFILEFQERYHDHRQL